MVSAVSRYFTTFRDNPIMTFAYWKLPSFKIHNSDTFVNATCNICKFPRDRNHMQNGETARTLRLPRTDWDWGNVRLRECGTETEREFRTERESWKTFPLRSLFAFGGSRLRMTPAPPTQNCCSTDTESHEYATRYSDWTSLQEFIIAVMGDKCLCRDCSRLDRCRGFF